MDKTGLINPIPYFKKWSNWDPERWRRLAQDNRAFGRENLNPGALIWIALYHTFSKNNVCEALGQTFSILKYLNALSGVSSFLNKTGSLMSREATRHCLCCRKTVSRTDQSWERQEAGGSDLNRKLQGALLLWTAWLPKARTKSVNHKVVLGDSSKNTVLEKPLEVRRSCWRAGTKK